MLFVVEAGLKVLVVGVLHLGELVRLQRTFQFANNFVNSVGVLSQLCFELQPLIMPSRPHSHYASWRRNCCAVLQS